MAPCRGYLSGLPQPHHRPLSQSLPANSRELCWVASHPTSPPFGSEQAGAGPFAEQVFFFPQRRQAPRLPRCLRPPPAAGGTYAAGQGRCGAALGLLTTHAGKEEDGGGVLTGKQQWPFTLCSSKCSSLHYCNAPLDSDKLHNLSASLQYCSIKNNAVRRCVNSLQTAQSTAVSSESTAQRPYYGL